MREKRAPKRTVGKIIFIKLFIFKNGIIYLNFWACFIKTDNSSQTIYVKKSSHIVFSQKFLFLRWHRRWRGGGGRGEGVIFFIYILGFILFEGLDSEFLGPIAHTLIV